MDNRVATRTPEASKSISSPSSSNVLLANDSSSPSMAVAAEKKTATFMTSEDLYSFDNNADSLPYQSKWESSKPNRDSVRNLHTDRNDICIRIKGTSVRDEISNIYSDGNDSDDELDGSTEEELYGSNKSSLPDFANAANRALHEETKRLERLRDETENHAEAHNDRVRMMEDHLHEIEHEIRHTDGLMAAKKKEIDMDNHFLALMDRETSRYHEDIKGTVTSIRNSKHILKSIQTQIRSTSEETEKLKESLNWNQEELEQWASAASREEGDNIALQRYAKEDELKIKELCLSIEKLTKSLMEKRARLENETAQTKAYQGELERVSDGFKGQHEERKELIKQWQVTIAMMRARDEDIGQISSKYAAVEKNLEEEMKSVAKAREALALLDVDKIEVEKNFGATEREVLFERQEYLSIKKKREFVVEKLGAMKIEMEASVQCLQTEKRKQNVAQGELEQKKSQLHYFQERCNVIKHRLTEERGATLSHERTAVNVEKALKEHKQELKQKVQREQSLKDKAFKLSQNLSILRKAEASLSANIECAQNSSKNLSSKLRELEENNARAHEVLYNADLNLQKIERRLARGLGARSEEKKLSLDERIAELEQDLKLQKEKRKSNEEEWKNAKRELQRWNRREKERKHEQDTTQNKIIELELEVRTCEASLEATSRRREESLVINDSTRLDVRRLRDALHSLAEEVHVLETQKEKLKTTISDRKNSSREETDQKTRKMRLCEEERHKLAVQLTQRKLTVDRLKKRHAHLCSLLPKSRNDKGAPDNEKGRSGACNLTEAAQKRDDLQREGDDLHRLVLRKESEIKAMIRTLNELNARNARLRKSLKAQKE